MPENLNSHCATRAADSAAGSAVAAADAEGRPGATIAISRAASGVFDAYLTAPQEDNVPGVVLISTIFGIDEDMKDMCDDLGRRGCVAIVPNFFWRDQDSGPLGNPAHRQRAIDRAYRLDFPTSMEDLQHAIELLKRHPRCNGKVALLGFCFGGPHAWRAACDGLGIDASLSFHGSFVSKYMSPDDRPACLVSFHYGDHDNFAPAEELEAVRKVAEPVGAEFVIHPGAGHGYMLPSVVAHYDAPAANASWDRALQMIDALRS